MEITWPTKSNDVVNSVAGKEVNVLSHGDKYFNGISLNKVRLQKLEAAYLSSWVIEPMPTPVVGVIIFSTLSRVIQTILASRSTMEIKDDNQTTVVRHLKWSLQTSTWFHTWMNLVIGWLKSVMLCLGTV